MEFRIYNTHNQVSSRAHRRTNVEVVLAKV